MEVQERAEVGIEDDGSQRAREGGVHDRAFLGITLALRSLSVPNPNVGRPHRRITGTSYGVFRYCI